MSRANHVVIDNVPRNVDMMLLRRLATELNIHVTLVITQTDVYSRAAYYEADNVLIINRRRDADASIRKYLHVSDCGAV